MKRMLQCLMPALVIFAMLVSSVCAEEFPARKKYPMATPISTEDLYAEYEAGNVVIVDVRSTIEYDVIHPVGAVHISVSSMKFLDQVKSLIVKNRGKKIAFY